MTKKELIEVLDNISDNAEIYFYDFPYNQYYLIDIAYFDGNKVVLEEQLPKNEDVMPQNAAVFDIHFRKQ